MRAVSTTLALAALTALATAHFNLKYPAARGFNEDKLSTFPCGGQDTISSRTPWPLSGGQVALKMGHIDAHVEVLIAIGNSPGSAFNTVLRPTFKETGLGSFCMTGFSIPSSLGAVEGMNATIQVVTNGDPKGGLYNCADVTLSTQAVMASSDVCKNASAVRTSAAHGKGSPNVTSSRTMKGSSAAGMGGVGNAWVGGLLVAGAAAWAVAL